MTKATWTLTSHYDHRTTKVRAREHSGVLYMTARQSRAARARAGLVGGDYFSIADGPGGVRVTTLVAE